MIRITISVTAREVNQRSGKLMARSRQDGVVIPVTFGRGGDVENYIVPNTFEAAEALLEHLRSQRAQKPTAARERFMRARSAMGGKVADTLSLLRDEDHR